MTKSQTSNAPFTAAEDLSPFKTFLGHPRPLWVLFSAEFWERFCYYGMRALLAVYVAATFFSQLPEGEANAAASLTYGAFTALVYATGMLGGYVADRLIGYQRSIIMGGLFMVIGMLMLLIIDLRWFLVGLAIIAVGNGLFKPNISTMVGKLYSPGDNRRDSGFTIFYMGINAGSLIAPIVCGAWIGDRFGFRYGFLAAAIGMLLGVIVFQFARRSLKTVGVAPKDTRALKYVLLVLIGGIALVPAIYFLLSKTAITGFVLAVLMMGLVVYLNTSLVKTASFLSVGVILGIMKFVLHREPSLDFSQIEIPGSYLILVALMLILATHGFLRSNNHQQRDRNIAMLILFIANMFFFALFEQAGSSLNFLARDYVDAPFHFSLFQSANPIFIILLAPLFAIMWPALDKRNFNPSIPRKFALALIGAGLGFLVLIFAIENMVGSDGKIPWSMLTLCYLVHTMAELCLSPIGLSMVTKLAAPKEVGLAMGGWFLSTAMANYLAGAIAATASGGGHDETVSGLTQYSAIFMQLVYVGIGVGLAYFLLAPLINKLMHGVK